MKLLKAPSVFAVLVAVSALVALGGCGTAASTGSTAAKLAATVTTAAPSTTTTIPIGWKKFDGGSISLALPANFTGGKPTAEDIKTAKAGMAQGASADDKAAIEAMEIPLMIYGPTNSTGDRSATVLVIAESLMSGESMQSYVEQSKDPTATQKIEQITNDHALVVLTASDHVQLMDFTRAGSTAYTVIYTAPTVSAKAMDSVFRTSAKTIKISGK